MNKFIKKPFAFAAVFTLLLVGFTVYVLLDTFVIPRVYDTVEAETYAVSVAEEDSSKESVTDSSSDTLNTDSESVSVSESISSEPVITESSYSDSQIKIEITKYREYNTDIYAADITIKDPELLKSALAFGQYGRNISDKISAIAKENNAILAINGDYYGARQSGYVLRNKNLYRATADEPTKQDLAIMNTGDFRLFLEGDASAIDMMNDGARQILSFGPWLVSDGEIVVDPDAQTGISAVSNPRTAIGQIDSLHYVMLTADGRTAQSSGLTMYQLAEFLCRLKVKCAYNLDGGGSSTMYFNGKVINCPTTNGNIIQERSVSDIVYIGY